MGGIVQGVGTVVAAKMQANAQNKATRSQEKSTREALQFEREQEAARKANYDRAYGMWDASRQELMRRYGITLPASTAPNPLQPTGAGSGDTALKAPENQVIRPHSGGVTIRDLAQEIPDWSDWGRYNLRNK